MYKLLIGIYFEPFLSNSLGVNQLSGSLRVHLPVQRGSFRTLYNMWTRLNPFEPLFEPLLNHLTISLLSSYIKRAHLEMVCEYRAHKGALF